MLRFSKMRIVIIILYFSFYSHLYSQKWEKSKLNLPNRIVHTMVSTKTGVYILEGRLMKGGRSNKMILLPENSHSYITTEAPRARDGHSLSIDKDGNLLSFGGNSSNGILNELWKYKNSTWQLIKPTNGISPSPRWGHGAIYFKNRLWVFGGKAIDKGKFHQDLWSWDGKVWKEHKSTLKPKGRYGLQLGIYKGEIVLYGGRNHSGDWFTDTWIWNNEWEIISPKNSNVKPGTSVGHTLITTNKELYLIGGILKGDSFKEMWKLNGNQWILINKNLPFQLDFPSGCFNPQNNSILISGSNSGNFELWEYKLL